MTEIFNEKILAAIAAAYQAAGVYLGMIMVIMLLQTAVLWRIKHRKWRTWALVGTIAAQSAIALLAVSVTATQDLRGCLP